MKHWTQMRKKRNKLLDLISFGPCQIPMMKLYAKTINY